MFKEGQAYGFNDFPSALGPIKVSYTSRWLTRPNNVRMPGQLWVEASGQGPDFETTVPVLANAALAGLPAMAVACNAAIQDPELEIAFDSTEGSSQREFFQAYVRPESNYISDARLAHPEAIALVTTAIATNEYRDQLLRASDQYRIALDSWAVGRESLTLAHLWMSVEALTVPQRDELKRTHQVQSNQDLALKLGVNIKELDGAIRRQYLLSGDTDCYRKAREASDGLEHGFLGFDVIRSNAAEVRERLAMYVRAAIFRLAMVRQSAVATLTAPPYDQPLGIWPLVKFITGTLEGGSPTLAKAGNAYPVVIWQHMLKSVEFDSDGKMHAQLQDRIQPELAEGLTLKLGTLQVWKGGSGIQLNAPLDPSKKQPVLQLDEADPPSPGNVVLTVDDPATTKWVQPLGSFALNCNTIRHLALFWSKSLKGKNEYLRRPTKFSKTVGRISKLFTRKGVPVALRDRCRAAWDEAIALDAMRTLLCSGAPLPEGLVLFDKRIHGKAPVASDVQKLSDLNDKAIKLVKELRNLLGELQALPMFKPD